MSEDKIGYIYCIRNSTNDDIYIGSTRQKKLSQRFSGHNQKFRMWKNGEHHYVSSFKILETGTAYIELLETHTDITNEELRKIEGVHIRSTAKCVNRCIAGRTKSEYHKEYAEKNKERIKEYKHERYVDVLKEKLSKETECECGQTVSAGHFKAHKKTEEHMLRMKLKEECKSRDELSAERKKAHQQRSDLKRNVVYACECGKSYTLGHKSRHIKTAFHIKFMENKQT